MSLIIDRKYIKLISTKLERFAQKSDYLWNFRCPVCGDSQKNKLKSRGYVYRRKNDLFFSCHNCATAMSMGNFLKFVDSSLFREYQMDRYKEESHGNVKAPDFSHVRTQPTFKVNINLPSIDTLPEEHIAKSYLVKRKLPRDRFSELYYASDFKAFVKEIQPDCDKTLYPNEKRIIIPFYDEKKVLLGFQGRAIDDSKVKYITIKLADDNRKIFGLDKIDFTKRIYVVEGPFDSLFLQNCIATMDAKLLNVISILGNHDYVFVHDNEPRNKDIIRQMHKTIKLGKNICIWPKYIVEKDINDMVCSGMTGIDIQGIIDIHTYNELKARLEFEVWKKM